MTDVDQQLLERLLDGELSLAETQHAEALLAHSEGARDYLAGLRRTREALSADVQAAIAVAPLSQLWDRIAPALAESVASAARSDDRSDRRTALVAGAPVAKSARAGTWARLCQWWGEQRLEASLGLAVAVCAVLLVIWAGGVADRPAALPDAPVAEAAATKATPKSPTGVVANNQFELESAEVELGTLVIDVDPEDPSSPAVVWHFVDEDNEEERI